MDAFIKEVAGICAQIKVEKGADKDIGLSFDEWNVWYHFKKQDQWPQKWIQARPIEEERYDFADALLVGSMLTTLINNADVVKIACLAQLVNTIAPIMTEPGGRSWVQTTYYPFLSASQYGRGTALKADVVSPVYDCATGSDIPFIDCAAVINEQGDELTFFMINKNQERDISCHINLSGFPSRELIEWVRLGGYAPDAVNTADHAPVCPQQCKGAVFSADGVELTLQKLSWNMLRLRL